MKKLTMLVLVALSLVACKGKKDADATYAADLLKPGTALPVVSLPDREGTAWSLDAFRGQYLVLDFWATWCPDCRADVPQMKSLYARFGDRVAFVGISFDTDPEKLDTYVQENDIRWLQLSDFTPKKESAVGAAFHVQWIPSMYLVDPEGKVVLGTVMIDKLMAKLESLELL